MIYSTALTAAALSACTPCTAFAAITARTKDEILADAADIACTTDTPSATGSTPTSERLIVRKGTGADGKSFTIMIYGRALSISAWATIATCAALSAITTTPRRA